MDMNKNLNYWMLSTIFLAGLIIGFGFGKIPTPMMVAYQAPQTTAAGDSTSGNTTNPTPPPTIKTTPSNTYASIEKSKDATGHYSLGNKNAKVKIQEFSDFQCPFCSHFFESSFPQILKEYVATGKVYYSYYNFPLGIHPQAPKAAEAALCAGEQDKYWEMHDLLFQNQNIWSGEDNLAPIFASLAQSLGMDANKFTTCVNSNKFADTVKKDADFGDSKKVEGTPTILINKESVIGAQDYAVFKKAIDDELKKKGVN